MLLSAVDLAKNHCQVVSYLFFVLWKLRQVKKSGFQDHMAAKSIVAMETFWLMGSWSKLLPCVLLGFLLGISMGLKSVSLPS